MKKILALDIGVSSLGWAISYYNDNLKEWDILDFGVRLWDVSEDSKTLDTLTQKRRQARASRRIIARRANRIKELKIYLEQKGFVSAKEIAEHYNKINTKNNDYTSMQVENNPLLLRYKGLSAQLTPLQIYLALLNIAKYRGYNNKFDIEDELESADSEKKKNFARLSKADKIIAEYQYPIKYLIEKDRKDNVISYHNNSISKRSEENIKAAQKLKGLSEKEITKQVAEMNEKRATDFLLFRRNHLKAEAKGLLLEQAKYYELLDNAMIEHILEKIIFRQRDFEDGPGPEGEALKAQWRKYMEDNHKKHLIYKSFLESKGKCEFFQDQYRASSFSIESDLFFIINEAEKILNTSFANNLASKKGEIQKIGKMILDTYLKELIFTENRIRELFIEAGEEFLRPKSGLSFAPPKETFLTKLAKYNKNYVLKNLALIDLDNPQSLTDNPLNKLGIILEENKTTERLIKRLSELDPSYFGNPREWLKENITLFKSPKTINVSKKFVHSVLEKTLKEGKLFSSYQYELREANKRKILEKKFEPFAPINDRDMAKNAVVYRAINQIRKVLKALYQREEYFDAIVIEVAKDLYAERDLRKSIRSGQDKREKDNKKDLERLKNENIPLSKENIERIKIWNSTPSPKNDQTLINDLYDIELKEVIKFADIFRGDVIQKDHIVPYSLINDNTVNNKVLTKVEYNVAKGNQTPIQWFRATGKSEAQIKDWIKKLGNFKKFKVKIGQLEHKKLTMLNRASADRNSDWGFETKDINDTRYITKYLKGYLEINLAKKSFQEDRKIPQILTVQGVITSNFRRLWLNPYLATEKGGSLWGIAKKNREITPFHHAIDALVLSNMYSKELIEFYQSAVRYYEYYNFLIDERKNNIFYSKLEIKEKLAELHENIKKQLTTNNFFKFENNNNFYLKKINNIYSNLLTSLDKMEKIKHIRFNDYQTYLNLQPRISDFSYKVNSLIPIAVKSEMVERDGWDLEGNPKKYPDISMKFDRIVGPEEWSEINKIDLLRYPYVSYKVDRRLRGSIFKDQNPISHKKAVKKDPNSVLLDKHGNYWPKSTYLGFVRNKDGTFNKVARYDASANKENILNKNLVLYQNAVFLSGEEIYIYKAITNERICVHHPNLKYHSKDAKFFELFNRRLILSISKIENFKNIDINLLGKKV